MFGFITICCSSNYLKEIGFGQLFLTIMKLNIILKVHVCVVYVYVQSQLLHDSLSDSLEPGSTTGLM